MPTCAATCVVAEQSVLCWAKTVLAWLWLSSKFLCWQEIIRWCTVRSAAQRMNDFQRGSSAAAFPASLSIADVSYRNLGNRSFGQWNQWRSNRCYRLEVENAAKGIDAWADTKGIGNVRVPRDRIIYIVDGISYQPDRRGIDRLSDLVQVDGSIVRGF